MQYGSALRFRDAAALGVDAVVDGSVPDPRARADHGVLIDARTTAISGPRYERDLGDILALQSEVARAIAGEIRVRLTPQEQASLARVWAIDPEAYQLYLKGRYHWEKRTEESLTRAYGFFRKAIDPDPTYAAAYAGLADISSRWPISISGRSRGLPEAKAARSGRWTWIPALAEAHTSMGSIRELRMGDRAGAERSFKRAIEPQPQLRDGAPLVRGPPDHAQALHRRGSPRS
jgi:hypothetical protein